MNEAATDQTLINSLVKCKLITTEQVEAARAALGDQSSVSGKEILESLLRQKLITKWQIQQVRSGHTSFFLDNNRYLLLDLIGRGGMGAVYKARHIRMNREVALKVIDPRRVTDPKLISRFQREVEVCSKLQHEHIVGAFDVGKQGNTTFLVLEYVEGSDLSALVRHDGVMAPEEAAAICLQAASGLAYSHAQGIIHRDIKPQNILLSTTGVTKILDMGLARIVEEHADTAHTGLTQDGAIMGTVDYMAPEQARDSHSADARADIYSLGATLYFLLSGRQPFPGGTTIEKLHRLANEEPQPLGQIRPDCPKQLTDIVERMMSKDLHKRFRTAEEVVRALKPLAAERIAGRPVVTASVQTAAETHRVGVDDVTEEFQSAFSFEPTIESVISTIRRKQSSAKLMWGMITAAVLVTFVFALIVWQFSGEESGKAANKTARQKQKRKPATAVPVSGDPPAQVKMEWPGHYGLVWSMAWSPDGFFLATGGGDGEVRIWDPLEGKTILTYRGHHSCVTALAWSADGKRIASGDVYGEIHVWSASNGKQETRLKRKLLSPFSSYFSGITFSPDGKHLVYQDAGNVFRWSFADKKIIWSAPSDWGTLAYAPDGAFLTNSSFRDGTIWVWDCETGNQILKLPGVGHPRKATFYEEDKLLVIQQGKIEIRNPRSGEIQKEVKLPEALIGNTGGRIRTFPFSIFPDPQGQQCLIFTEDGLKLINLVTGESKSFPTPAFHHQSGIWTVSSTLGRFAVVSGWSLHLFQTSNGQQLATAPIGRAGVTRPVLVGNRYLLTSLGFPAWDLNIAESLENFPQTPHLSADGSLRGLVEDRILKWPSPNAGEAERKLLARLQDFDKDPNPDLHWFDNGEAVWERPNARNHVRIWDATTGKILRTVSLGEELRPANISDTFPGPAFSTNGNVMAVGYYKKLFPSAPIRVWRGNMEKPSLEFFTGFGNFVRILALSPDGRLIATTHDAVIDPIHLWSAEDGRKIATFNTGFRSGLHPVYFEFSSSSRYLLVTRQIWDVTKLEKVWECPEQDHAVGPTNYLIIREAGALFDDERHVVIVQDMQYQIWDWRDNKKRATFFLLPGGWAIVNHETGHWNGSPLAFEYLRFLHKDKAGKTKWLKPFEYQKQTGWKNDPSKAGLKLTP